MRILAPIQLLQFVVCYIEEGLRLDSSHPFKCRRPEVTKNIFNLILNKNFLELMNSRPPGTIKEITIVTNC